MNLSIIIPLYNESNTIVKVLARLVNLDFPEFINRWELIVVDDCSTDASKELVEEFIDGYDNIQLLSHNENKGKGSSIRTGVKKMNGDVLLIQDADLELYPEDIPSMLNAMDELGVLFVNGSRYLPGVNRPLFAYNRYLGNKFFSFLTSLLINVKITDMACGYKLITRALYNEINPKENRFAIEAELMLKALKIQRNIISEVPVRYLPRNEGEGKKLRNSDAFKVLWKIVEIGVFGKIN